MSKLVIALVIVAVVMGGGGAVTVPILMPETFTAMLSTVQTLQESATPPPAAPPATPPPAAPPATPPPAAPPATPPPAAPPAGTGDGAECDRLLAQVLNPSTPFEEFDRIEAELLRNNCGG